MEEEKFRNKRSQMLLLICLRALFGSFWCHASFFFSWPQDEQMTLESFAVGALEERQMSVQRNGRPK